jgi:hypothetical protein
MKKPGTKFGLQRSAGTTNKLEEVRYKRTRADLYLCFTSLESAQAHLKMSPKYRYHSTYVMKFKDMQIG